MDLETCSWCVEEVEFASLVETDDGALICVFCAEEHPDRVPPC